MKKTTVAFLFFLTLLFFIGQGKTLSQPISKEGPLIKLGEITFRVREIESSPSALKILEIYIEVLNRSRTATAPANSIKVVVSQKEIVYAGPKPAEGFTPVPQEVALSIPLPPLTGRVIIFGLPLPKEKVESITFEIHLNPPDGEKKGVKWEGS